jgi:hypothetical protein
MNLSKSFGRNVTQSRFKTNYLYDHDIKKEDIGEVENEIDLEFIEIVHAKNLRRSFTMPANVKIFTTNTPMKLNFGEICPSHNNNQIMNKDPPINTNIKYNVNFKNYYI